MFDLVLGVVDVVGGVVFFGFGVVGCLVGCFVGFFFVGGELVVFGGGEGVLMIIGGGVSFIGVGGGFVVRWVFCFFDSYFVNLKKI